MAKFLEITQAKAAPRRKRKPKPTPLDNFEPYLKVKSILLQGKMRPMEMTGMLLDASDAKQLKMLYPWRTVADRLKLLLHEMHLESDYTIRKYETDTPGVWFVGVTANEPPMAAKPRDVRRQEAG